jgi:hypothetical protein
MKTVMSGVVVCCLGLLLLGVGFALSPKCLRYEYTGKEECWTQYILIGSVMTPVEHCGPQRYCSKWETN